MNHRKAISCYYPAYMKDKAGQPTYFVEKIWNSLLHTHELADFMIATANLPDMLYVGGTDALKPKIHTIRKLGKRPVKVGDTIQFFVWEGRPYWSKQIIVTPPIPILKVLDFKCDGSQYLINNVPIAGSRGDELAQNDGLNWKDLLGWFKYPKPFKGQIIFWNDKISY